MSVVQFDSLEFIGTPGGNTVAGVATPSRGATGVSIIRQRQEPGGFNPRHTHDREEVVTVLSGVVTVRMNDENHALGAGDTLIIPAETVHQFANSGSVAAEWLLIAPAGYRFYRESGEDATPSWSL